MNVKPFGHWVINVNGPCIFGQSSIVNECDCIDWYRKNGKFVERQSLSSVRLIAPPWFYALHVVGHRCPPLLERVELSSMSSVYNIGRGVYAEGVPRSHATKTGETTRAASKTPRPSLFTDACV